MNKAPQVQKTPKPISQTTTLSAVIKADINQDNKPLTTNMALRQQRLSYQVYRLQKELRETKDAYQELMQKHDSLLNKVNEALQKKPQKAESGNEN